MKILILSPNTDILFSEEEKLSLATVWTVVYIKDIRPLAEIEELFSDEPKIVAIDPDFCDRKVSDEVLSKMKSVQAICLQTTSFSWINLEIAKSMRIPVVNLRWFSTQAVAERAMLMTLQVARKLPLVIKNNWEYDYGLHQWIELKWKHMWIIGMWAIWTAMAELASWFGMDVSYWSKNSRDQRFNYAELPALMCNADVLFVALAKSAETKGIITDELLRSMKNTAIFVSVVHDVYDHELVLELAANQEIYWYAFETSKKKMCDFEGNVWAWPELAWCTNESLKRNANQRTQAIVRAAWGEFHNQVNL